MSETFVVGSPPGRNLCHGLTEGTILFQMDSLEEAAKAAMHWCIGRNEKLGVYKLIGYAKPERTALFEEVEIDENKNPL